jgi:hypothetical protein
VFNYDPDIFKNSLGVAQCLICKLQTHSCIQ